MPEWFALVAMVALVGLTFLEGRALTRSVRSGVPHGWFRPHPTFARRTPNRHSPMLWFGVVIHAAGAVIFGFAAVICGAFFLGLG